MADASSKSSGTGDNSQVEVAARVLENLAELEPELVNAGIFDRDREAIFVTSGSDGWPARAGELLAALEAASGDEEADFAHLAAAEGEVFAVSESGLWLVAVTGRFVLASLAAYDMRMALRDVARADSVKCASEAENKGSVDA